jgi:hypothetical protein
MQEENILPLQIGEQKVIQKMNIVANHSKLHQCEDRGTYYKEKDST